MRPLWQRPSPAVAAIRTVLGITTKNGRLEGDASGGWPSAVRVLRLYPASR